MENRALQNYFLLKILYTFFLSICIIFGFHLSVQGETRDWNFDDASQYTVSNPAAIEVNGGVAQTKSSFDSFGWNYRKSLTIDNPNSEQYAYQVEVKLDSSHSDFWDHVASDGSDILFTDSDGMTFIDFYIYHFDYTLKEAGIWVKVPEISTSAHTIYLYYGNETATDASDIVATFTYDEPKKVGYVVSYMIAATGLNIISLTNGNTIEVGGTLYKGLKEREKITVNEDLSQSTPISAKGLFHADGSANGTDMISPVSWASTEFTYYSQRYTNTFSLLSPWGEATVDIYSNGSSVLEKPIKVDSTGTAVVANITDYQVVRILSDIPILVQHLSTASQDSGVYYPASEEYLYGIASNYLQIGSGPDGAEVSWINSDGTEGNRSLGSNQGYSQSGGGSQGAGPAFRVKTLDSLIGVSQLADSDGTEFTTFLPKKELGTRFGANNIAQYIAIAAPEPDTECTVYDSTGNIVSTQMGGSRTDVNKIYFGSTSGYNWEDAGWECECSKPVYAYYEKENGGSGEPSDETNLMSYPQMRQFTYPTPTIGDVGVEESLFTSGNPWVSPTSENAQSFSLISDFLETAQKNGGEIYYQLSNDGGNSWRYWNGTSWSSADPDDYNTADSLQENITSFPAGGGSFLFKAFLVSDGSVQVKLDNIQIAYLINLQVTDIDPSAGYNDTPTSVEVSGENFKEGAEVFVNGFLCEVTSVTANSINAIIPTGMIPGIYDVSVENPDGEIATLPDAFLVKDSLDPPDDSLKVTDIDPSSGYNDVPTSVKVSGESFKAGAEVFIDGFLCEVTAVSDDTIDAIIPAGITPGIYDVSIKNLDEEIATLPDAFLVIHTLDPPDDNLQVTDIDPSAGYNDTPTSVKVSGESFKAGAEVFINGFVCEVTAVSDDTIDAFIPAGITPGIYDVLVKNPDGEIATLPVAFLVIDASDTPDPDLPPSVEGLYPSNITSGEDTPVVILGENFVEIPEVVIGKGVLSKVEYVNSNTLKVTVPGDIPTGSHDITVINPEGLSCLLEDGLVVMEPNPPVVLYLLPDSTLSNVAADVAIIGSNFEEDSRVALGHTELTDVTYISSTTLMGTVPAGMPVGVYDVVVTNSNGHSGRREDAFTVIAAQPPPPKNVDLTIFPKALLGSRWVPLFKIVLIKCEDITFTPSSLVSFDSDDIRIWNQWKLGDHKLLVLLSIKPDPQEGTVSISISDVDLGGEIVAIADEDALNISLIKDKK